MVLIGFNNLIKKENKMFYFYLNKNAQPSGEHEIHKDKCSYLPHPFNREYLGYLSNFSQAKEAAKKLGYKNVDGCAHCCPEGHHK